MSTTAPPGSTIPEVRPPSCQHCATPLPLLGLYAYQVGGFAILNLYCPHCQKALHFQIFQKSEESGVQIPS